MIEYDSACKQHCARSKPVSCVCVCVCVAPSCVYNLTARITIVEKRKEPGSERKIHFAGRCGRAEADYRKAAGSQKQTLQSFEIKKTRETLLPLPAALSRECWSIACSKLTPQARDRSSKRSLLRSPWQSVVRHDCIQLSALNGQRELLDEFRHENVKELVRLICERCALVVRRVLCELDRNDSGRQSEC